MKQRKWQRLETITDDERRRLDRLCKKTSGLHSYGNRARMAVIVPVDIAEKIARMMDVTGLSASAVCCDLLSHATQSLSVDDYGDMIEADRLRSKA